VEVKGQIGRGRGLEIGARRGAANHPGDGERTEGGSRIAGERERRRGELEKQQRFKLARVLVKRRH